MIRTATILTLLPALASAQEATSYDCLTGDGRAFRVELWQPHAFGDPLHCVSGLDLGLAPCAPDGGWGLSDPADADDLMGTTRAPADLRGAPAKFFARVGPSEFVASASIGEGMPLALEVHGITVWRMRLTLATGEGTMFTRDGAVPLRCGGIESGP